MIWGYPHGLEPPIDVSTNWDATLVRLQLLRSMSQAANVLAEPRNAPCYPGNHGNGKSHINVHLELKRDEKSL